MRSTHASRLPVTAVGRISARNTEPARSSRHRFGRPFGALPRRPARTPDPTPPENDLDTGSILFAAVDPSASASEAALVPQSAVSPHPAIPVD